MAQCQPRERDISIQIVADKPSTSMEANIEALVDIGELCPGLFAGGSREG